MSLAQRNNSSPTVRREPPTDSFTDESNGRVSPTKRPRTPIEAVSQKLTTFISNVNWTVFLWNLLTLPGIGLVYWVINAQGIRLQMPVFGMRLYKLPIPGFAAFKDYEGFYRMDLACVFAMILLFAVWYLWIVTVKLLLHGQDETLDPTLNQGRYLVFLLTMSAIVIGCDTIIFYCGLADQVDSMWGQQSPFVPVVATMLYTAVLAFIATIHVRLSLRYTHHV